ncbi:MAG: hypothetical protein IJ231_11020 [Clostridia bacterium]|nr:hypothetical protein [Clostridia bacterium]
MRDIYSGGLIAGLSYTEMRHMLPGFILDMALMRADYDSKINWGKPLRRMAGAGEE